MGTALIIHRRQSQPWTVIEDYSVFDIYDNYMVCPYEFNERHGLVSAFYDERAGLDLRRALKAKKHTR